MMTLHQSCGAPVPVSGNMGILYLQEIGEDALRNGNPYEVEQTATEQKRMLKDQEEKRMEQKLLNPRTENLQWMQNIMANFGPLVSKLSTQRQLGKRSMILGGSWG